MDSFDFDQINLVPNMCVVGSRSECDTSILLKKGDFSIKYEVPIIPANMECVINEELAIKLAKANMPYSYHRFGDTVSFAESMKRLNLPVSISVGVNEDSREILENLKSKNLIPDILTVDIAHGHSIKMRDMLEYINKNYPNTFIIAGNVSTSEALRDLEIWGADAIKVGIGPGSACTTYPATGFGSRGCQASVIRECFMGRRKNPKTLIIADGGIREPGDIAKSLALGADMVMVGGMMSGFLDSPGNEVSLGGKLYKEFWGSASHFQSNKSSRIEGTKNLIELKPITLLKYFEYLKECLQSSISYAGGMNLSALRNVRYLRKALH
jgi:GMP reductase